VRRNGRPILFLSLLAVLAGMPLLLYGYPFGHDVVAHSVRVQHFTAQLLSGEFYPRWMAGMNGGLGSPDFFVYGPAPFYITAVFAAWMDPLHALAASTLLAIWLSGLVAYFWLRSVATGVAATIGACFYMLAPYHLAIDVYERAAFAESWAFVWMPLVLLFMERLRRGKRGALSGISVAYALLVMTHPITAVLFTPVVLLFGWRKGVASCLDGVLLGAGLSAFYIIPAIAHERYVSTSGLRVDPDFHWARHFLWVDRGLLWLPASDQSFRWALTWTLLLTLGLGLLCLRRRSMFWTLAATAAALFMTPLSAPLWEWWGIVRALQFPWRAQAIVTLAVAALLAAAIEAGRPRSVVVTLTAALVTLVPFATVVMNYPARQAYHEAPMGIGYDVITRVWSKAQADPGGIEQLSRLPEGSFLTGGGSLRVERQSARVIHILVETETGATIQLRRLYYPGWEFEIGGRAAPTRPDALGLISFEAPAGQSSVIVRLPWEASEKAGMWVSLASLLGVISLTVRPYVRPSGESGAVRRDDPK